MSIKLSNTATKAVQGLSDANTQPRPVDYDAEMDNTISDLNQAGISLTDYPPSTRHRAFVLEGKITKAANEGRQEDFLRLLSEWRNCFN